MAKYFSVARDTLGNVISEATVTVYDAQAGVGGEAVIYSDSELETVKSNPFTSNTDGSFSFFAYTGIYKVVVNKSGYVTNVQDDIQLWGKKEHSTAGKGQTAEVLVAEAQPHNDIVIRSGRATVSDPEWGSGDGGDILIYSGVSAAPKLGGDIFIDSVAGDLNLTANVDVIITSDASQIKLVADEVIGTVNVISLTISSGSIALPSHSAPAVWHCTVDTQNGDPTDNLDTITNLIQGDIIYLKQADPARDVTFVDVAGGTGQMQLQGNYTPGGASQILCLAADNTIWNEVSRI